MTWEKKGGLIRQRVNRLILNSFSQLLMISDISNSNDNSHKWLIKWKQIISAQWNTFSIPKVVQNKKFLSSCFRATHVLRWSAYQKSCEIKSSFLPASKRCMFGDDNKRTQHVSYHITYKSIYQRQSNKRSDDGVTIRHGNWVMSLSLISDRTPSSWMFALVHEANTTKVDLNLNEYHFLSPEFDPFH